MTTTTPGCPAAGYLKEGVANSAWSVTGVEFVDVRITFEPAWKPDMMTVQARTDLGFAACN
jgi:metal-sulfur cluster biosynthetic enzyme